MAKKEREERLREREVAIREEESRTSRRLMEAIAAQTLLQTTLASPCVSLCTHSENLSFGSGSCSCCQCYQEAACNCRGCCQPGFSTQATESCSSDDSQSVSSCDSGIDSDDTAEAQCTSRENLHRLRSLPTRHDRLSGRWILSESRVDLSRGAYRETPWGWSGEQSQNYRPGSQAQRQ